MWTFVVHRLVRAGFVCLGISLITFTLLHVGGDPVLLLVPPSAPGAGGASSPTRRGSVVDRLCTVGAVTGQAMPIFWLGIMLIIVFAVKLRLLPASGRGPPAPLVLPAFPLRAAPAPPP